MPSLREVLEETGVTVVDARYHSSQPWPFPSSLMIGFTAHRSARRRGEGGRGTRGRPLVLACRHRRGRRGPAAAAIGFVPPDRGLVRLGGQPSPCGRPRASGSGAPECADRHAPGLVGIEDRLRPCRPRSAQASWTPWPAAVASSSCRRCSRFFPIRRTPTLLGTGKLAGLAGTTSAAARFIRHVESTGDCVLPAAGGAFVAALAGAWLATGVSPSPVPRAGAACC